MKPETSPYDAAIADLEARINAMQVTLDNLKALRAQALGAGAVLATPADSGNIAISRDMFSQMTVKEAVAKYLRLVNRPKPTTAIADALLAGGLKTQSTRFSEMLRIGLYRDPRFERQNGEWGLTEWHTGTKKNKEALLIKRGNKRRPQATQTGDSRNKRVLETIKSDPSKNWKASEVAAILRESTKKVATAMWLLAKQGKLMKADVGYEYIGSNAA